MADSRQWLTDSRLWVKRRRLLRLSVDDALAGVAEFAGINVSVLQIWLHTYVACMRRWLYTHFKPDDFDCPDALELADVVCFYAVAKAWMLNKKRLSPLATTAIMTLVWSHLYFETSSPSTHELITVFSIAHRPFYQLYMSMAVEQSGPLVRVLTHDYDAVEAELAYFASVAASR